MAWSLRCSRPELERCDHVQIDETSLVLMEASPGRIRTNLHFNHARITALNAFPSRETGILLAVLIILSLSSQANVVRSESIPIEHILILYEENRTFDHYFGTYPGANGLPLHTALPKTPGSNETVAPFHLTTTKTKDLDHSSRAARIAYDNGKMDGFVYVENSNLTMGYYDYRDLPYYWDYASKFVLMDNFYTSQMGPSLPNHLYLIAGQSGGLIDNPGRCQSREICKEPSRSPYELPSNLTFDFRNVMDELDSRGISWKYYNGGREDYKDATYWNPLPSFESFKKNQSRLSHLAPNDQFLIDLANGNLAKVVWVIPKEEESDHPSADVKAGERYIVSMINAIMQSKYWSSTAVFVTWDDYGGWYDHVPPPQIDAFGLGFRVPCLIISPYAKDGFVDHTQSEFTSILKFIETVHGLSPLTHRDTMASDMLEAFDFSQSPRPPLILPGPYIPDHYPLTLGESAIQASDLITEASDLRSQVLASNFTSWEGRDMVALGLSEHDLAERAFARNDFAAAKEHAQIAIDFFEKAFSVEQTYKQDQGRQDAISTYVVAVTVSILLIGSVAFYLVRKRAGRRI
jgi:phospholipase C